MIRPYAYQRGCINDTVLALENSERALIKIASGLGKTVIAAFVSKILMKRGLGKGLFLCNQNDGLKQSMQKFQEVLGKRTKLGLFNGTIKDGNGEKVLFASFQSLANRKEGFRQDEFGFIFVDESHHTQAETYRPVVDYFAPKALVGLTATPERSDRKDICEIFGNPTVDIPLEVGIANGWLTDVEYRIVTDGLNKRKLRKITKRVLVDGERVSIGQINKTLFIRSRDEEIGKIIEKHGNKKTIIFTESIDHANYFAKFLAGAEVYHSGPESNDDVLQRFRKGTIRRIIVVDKLNECINVPDAELIVFLRCTHSRTIFLQQLGRGLRKAEGKKRVIVLDFVANVKRIAMLHEIISRIKEIRPDKKLTKDKFFIDGAFYFVFTDKQIDLLRVLDKLKHKTVADVPELLAEYSDKNDCPAQTVSIGAWYKVWWKCKKCDHEYHANVSNRYSLDSGCPGCANKVLTPKNNLAFVFPYLVPEYSPTNPLPADKVIASSSKKHRWKCRICGFDWTSDIYRRGKEGKGCPKCAYKKRAEGSKRYWAKYRAHQILTGRNIER